MRYSTTINNLKAKEWGLDIKQAYLFAWFYELPSWAEKLTIQNETYFFASKTKAVEELPLLTDKIDTMYRHYKNIERKGLVQLKKLDGKDYVKLTDLGKTWNHIQQADSEENPSARKKIRPDSEKNPNELGKISENNSEKNPTYKYIILDNNTRDNNITDNTLLSKIKISDVKKEFQVHFEIAKAFQLLFIKNLEEKNAPIKSQTGARLKSYVDPIRLMMQSDGVTKEQLQIVYKFLGSPEGEFWKSNILSTKTLRTKFNQLIIKAQQKHGKTNNGNNTQTGGASEDFRRKTAARLGIIQPD